MKKNVTVQTPNLQTPRIQNLDRQALGTMGQQIIRCMGVLGLAVSLKGCMPAAVVGGTTVVASSVAEERGLGGVISDVDIKTRLNFLYSSRDPDLFADVDIAVRQGRVLLTGTVATLQKQIDAVRYAWEIKGVREVIDELKVGKGSDLGEAAKDAWITTQLKTQLLFDGDVLSVNYNVQTVEGVLYLMGIAQHQKELDHVLDVARHIEGVQKVVSYVKLKEAPLYFKEEGSFEVPLTEPSSQQTAGVQSAQPAQQAQKPVTLARPNRASAFD